MRRIEKRPRDSRAARLEPDVAADVDAADAPVAAVGVDVISNLKAAGLSLILHFAIAVFIGGFEVCVDCEVPR